jgi:hypothetical protein
MPIKEIITVAAIVFGGICVVHLPDWTGCEVRDEMQASTGEWVPLSLPELSTVARPTYEFRELP